MGHGRHPVGGVRGAVTLASVLLAVVAAVSCDDPTFDRQPCDRGAPRCRTLCDTWCDGWGCYPSCWNQCWDNCNQIPPPPDVAVPADSGASSAPPADGGSGTGVLCSACTANDECESGALCILRGGVSPDAGGSATGFCSHACRTGSDCPQGFTCTQIGPQKQCLPNAGSCP